MRRACALLLFIALPLAAQNPPPRPDTARARVDSAARRPDSLQGLPDSLRPRRDTTRRDSTAPPDSLKPDSMEAVLPPFGSPPGPQPALRRMVFDEDFIRSSGAMSLGELLERVPG